jgi:hypothetical protein
VAAPIAYEQPTLMKAWGAFVAHLPTLLVVWITTGVLVMLSPVLMELMLNGMAISPDSLDSVDDVSSSLWPSGYLLVELVRLPLLMLSALALALVAVVPILYYETGKIISIGCAFEALFRRPWRYLLAGIFFQAIFNFGLFLCILPGVIVLLLGPVYVTKIFTTDLTIFSAFGSSFQAVYRSNRGRAFVAIELLVIAILLVLATLLGLAVASTGLSLDKSFLGIGVVVAISFSVSSFYIQNTAHRQGVLR